MKVKNCQKIESGLLVLAKIIAREEIKNQSLKVSEFTTFPSIGSNLNSNVIKRESISKI